MHYNYMTAVHGLRLIPVGEILNYGRTGRGVVVRHTKKVFDPGAIPGSITVADKYENWLHSKKITFKRGNMSLDTTARLDSYLGEDFVCLYVDETGNVRVFGSPGHPARFTFLCADGVYECELACTERLADGFMV